MEQVNLTKICALRSFLHLFPLYILLILEAITTNIKLYASLLMKSGSQ